MKARIAIRDIIHRPALGLDEWRQVPPPLRKRFYEEAVKFYDGFIQQDNSNPALQYEAAISYAAIAGLHNKAGEPQQAEKAFTQSIEILDRLVTAYPDDRSYRSSLAWGYFHLGGILLGQSRGPGAANRCGKSSRNL